MMSRHSVSMTDSDNASDCLQEFGIRNLCPIRHISEQVWECTLKLALTPGARSGLSLSASLSASANARGSPKKTAI